MRVRRFILILLCVLGAAGAWLFWPHVSRPLARAWAKFAAPHKTFARPGVVAVRSLSTAPHVLPAALCPTNAVQSAATATNKFPYRLANTRKTIGELLGDRHAILLENALIDTRLKLDLTIPKNLQSHGAPGAYIVQADGPIDGAFRARLAAAGAQIVSYIPNNAYLVQVASPDAGALASQPGVQAVLPFEPYYKVQPSLMQWVEEPLPAGATLNVGVFPGNEQSAIREIQDAGGQVLSQDGSTLHVVPPADWTALAQMSLVHIVEPSYQRAVANDLARVTVGVSTDTTNALNYLNLYGSNVLVEVNDTGIDTNHPDFNIGGYAGHPGSASPNRVILDSPLSGTDTNGHGTHVAGIIAGNGSESYSITKNTPPGSVTNADFRGKAPLARLYSVAAVTANAYDDSGRNDDFTDMYLQEAPALTNALISNNSWRYLGDNTYDLAAASYDAAVRDALPGVTGSQPVLFVFAAGNEGGGDDNGGGATADTVASPATAKNVISVGAIEQLRNITNTYFPRDSTNPVAAWAQETDTGYQVAGYSSRGNVGVGTEGAFGRFKPDVVAPGTFVISTRSTEWDTNAYYNPTNDANADYTDQVVQTNSLNDYLLSIPENAVSVVITIVANANSPTPFPANLPIYVSTEGDPDPTDPTTYDFVTSNNVVAIPPDGATYLAAIQDGAIVFAVGNSTNFAVNYDVDTDVFTTNDLGTYFDVLRTNLNDPIAPWYRYETGTSMSAPAVSGVLALMQDFFTNTLHSTPSPALLKAMIINGAREVGNYPFAVTNTVNDMGWGLIHLPNSLPFSTNSSGLIVTNTSIFFSDQSPSNALATGDTHTYAVGLSNAVAQSSLPLRVTLVWTDPPGDPAAAIKLVNSLELVVTNLSSGAVYYGNNFANSGNPPFSLPSATNGPAPVDVINNVQNVFIAPPLGTNYSVAVIGHGVNVNAVTAQTNNITQDYALVISSGEGEVSNALAVADNGIVSNPTGDQLVTVVTATNSALLNQYVGANSPLLGTNSVAVAVGATAFGTNAVITLGQTNQWHFYLVTNTGTASDFTNAAFITFNPPTLSLPRMGVYADSQADATKPEADIDLYVSTDPTITNLNPAVISNCISGGVAIVPGTTFNSASLTRGGTEFVADTNSTPGEVYYVGVKSEDAAGSEYGFLAVFTDQPFSTTDGNGNVTAHGFALPASIPDGSPAHPGLTNIFALCLSPVTAAQVIVTNQVWHQNFGDLVGVLQHNNVTDVLNNHRGQNYNTVGLAPVVYDDVHSGAFPGSIPSDGPGSLRNYVGQNAIGVWELTEEHDALTQTGAVESLDLLFVPHRDLTSPIVVTNQPQSWFYDYIDVPVGYTNLTVEAVDRMPNPPNYLYLGVQFGSEPTSLTASNVVQLTNVLGNSLENAISTGPPLAPGRYYVGIYNPDTVAHTVIVEAFLYFSQSAIETVTYTSAGPVPLLDDAVTTDNIQVTDIQDPTAIQSLSVGLRVDHPRISDLAFSLIGPDGSRYSLMENRGGTSTNGCGVTVITTNIINVTANGTAQPNTNVINVGESSGSFPITYNFYTAPDEMTVYYGNDTLPANLIYDTGVTNNVSLGGGPQNTVPVTITVNFPPPGVSPNSTYLTIVMDQYLSTNRSDAWTYTAGGVLTNYYYLTLTEDTNLTTTPIKFAPTPFVPSVSVVTNPIDDFETDLGASPGDYSGSVDNFFSVDNNQVSVVANPVDAQAGSNYLALANGTISGTLPTIQGDRYSLNFFYRGPGIAGWWQADSNAVDAIYGDNGILENGMGYTSATTTPSNGVVNEAFYFNGVNNFVLVQATKTVVTSNATTTVVSTNSALDIGQGSGFTIEGWIWPSNLTATMLIVEYERVLASPNGSDVGVQFGLNSGSPGDFDANIKDTNGVDHVISPAGSSTLLTNGTWQHVALTYDKNSGNATFYINGSQVAQTNIGTFTPQTSFTNILLGGRTFFNSVASPNAVFNGAMDEISFYSRALSDSEILAIFENNGGLGKYDSSYYNNFSPAGSLAEASVTIAGSAVPTVINGNNTNWQQEAITFTATGNGTPVSITGTEPGMLLDSFTLTALPSDLYYLPEQDMTPVVDQNAYGTWQLEVLDDRAGATNNATLVSWQLQFTFANTNIGLTSFGQLFGAVAQTNSLIGGTLGNYTVIVPTNASYATNILLFSSLPVNVWFDTNNPPTTNLFFLPDATYPSGTSGLVLLSTTNAASPQPAPNIYGDETYYLVVQNTNTSTVTFGVEVDFDRGNFQPNSRGLLAFNTVKTTAKGAQLQWPAAAGSQYEVQWADSLTSPMVWHTLTNPHATTIHGVTTFSDNGSQTGPPSQTRFYRLVQIK